MLNFEEIRRQFEKNRKKILDRLNNKKGYTVNDKRGDDEAKEKMREQKWIDAFVSWETISSESSIGENGYNGMTIISDPREECLNVTEEDVKTARGIVGDIIKKHRKSNISKDEVTNLKIELNCAGR